MDKARRYNKGKLRYELIPHFAKEQLADVYTKGAHKYSIYKDKEGKEILGSSIPISEANNYELVDDASANWRKGLPWMDTIASVERHIEAWKSGEDLDKELNTFHLANAAWGLFSLLEFYQIYPQGDNRPHVANRKPRIALDLDDVCVSYVPAWCKMRGLDIPHCWSFDRGMIDKFDSMKYEGALDEFYMGLEPKIDPKELPFEPVAYVTARPIDSKITEAWLDKHGFPIAPVHTVGVNNSKLDILKELNVDIFVDDNYKTFTELNANGVCCYLMDAPHNSRYNVGYRRIYSLKEIM